MDEFTYRAWDGAAYSNLATVTLNVLACNDPPTVAAGADAVVGEGSEFRQQGNWDDPDAGGAWTATVDYGDGSGAMPLVLNPGKTFELSHVYADNGTYTVTVTVTDDDGASQRIRSS